MSFWDSHASTIDLDRFRAQEQFLGDQDLNRFPAMLEYIRSLPVDYLWPLREDGSFGVVCREVDGVMMSRDLHDSIVEIDVMSRIFGLPLGSMRVLDVGAGYGRMAHRMTTMFPGCSFACTDEVAISRRACEIYLAYHNVNAEIIEPKGYGRFDLALNIHSWPECTRAQIASWLDWLHTSQVTYLFVVPHLDGGFTCYDDGASFLPEILRYYAVGRHWRGPAVWPRDMYLFVRTP